MGPSNLSMIKAAFFLYNGELLFLSVYMSLLNLAIGVFIWTVIFTTLLSFYDFFFSILAAQSLGSFPLLPDWGFFKFRLLPQLQYSNFQFRVLQIWKVVLFFSKIMVVIWIKNISNLGTLITPPFNIRFYWASYWIFYIKVKFWNFEFLNMTLALSHILILSIRQDRLKRGH